jgi:hydroxymethylbilane synthase
MSALLRIATRGSRLALWQAQRVADRLRAFGSVEVELVTITTAGDRLTHESLGRLGGVGVFTREIQNALLDGRADLAVHSLKDLPTTPVEGITLAAVPERGSPWDALVLPAQAGPAIGPGDLPPNARVGTGSLRRQAQLRRARQDLRFLEVRGNVETRLEKLDRGDYDALLLAEAGLDRLGLATRVSCPLRPPDVFPAAGQGAIGVECRAADEAVRSLLAQINDPARFACAQAEREILFRLGAGCHAPVGVVSGIEAHELVVEAVVLSADGSTRLHARRIAALEEPIPLGAQVAADLLQQGAAPLVATAPPADPAPP